MEIPDTDTELLMCNLLTEGGALTYMEKYGAFLLKSSILKTSKNTWMKGNENFTLGHWTSTLDWN